jgi:Alpha/beta hydrolase family
MYRAKLDTVFDMTNTTPSVPEVFDVHESPHPIVLVPGFWLGAWAWDELGTALRADGHEITAQTLPGLESADADRSAITLSDHVDAVCETVTAAGAPVVLAVHSAAGFPGYAASDRIREKIAAKVNDEQLETFRRRAVPQPGAVIREAVGLTYDARLDIPSTATCTGYTSEQYKDAVEEGYPCVRAFAELQNRHLDRATPEPLADVVAPARARRDHRRRRQRRSRGPTNTCAA